MSRIEVVYWSLLYPSRTNLFKIKNGIAHVTNLTIFKTVTAVEREKLLISVLKFALNR